MKTDTAVQADLIGKIPGNEPMFRKRARIHQAWWRINVLREPYAGYCSRINDEDRVGKNFLTDNIRAVVYKTLKDRTAESRGLIEANRLYSNLLSSQPLCFNFFGELSADKDFALRVLKSWWPELTKVVNVIFEFAPTGHFDNSAFDVAFEVMAGERKGLIGLECKYTDTFSIVRYTNQEYDRLFDGSAFKENELIENVTHPKYNQLFRNQMIAEALKERKIYDFACSGLFCYPYDRHALIIADHFRDFFKDPNEFKVITYTDFISKIMTLNISSELKVWHEKLVERYLALNLSEDIYKKTCI